MTEDLKNPTLQNDPDAIVVTAEDTLGPPKIDVQGIGIMMAVSILSGLAASAAMLFVSFMFLGGMSLDRDLSGQTNVFPVVLATITFFTVFLGESVYIFSARVVFPHIYKYGKVVFLHNMVYMIILYICILPIYMVANFTNANISEVVLVVYLLHVLLSVFGLDILLSIISQYRYAVLSFYANIASLMLTGGIVFWVYSTFSDSGRAMFVLIILPILTFVIFTGFSYLIRMIYHQYYIVTGNDPIATIAIMIENEEKEAMQDAENNLLQS